MLSSDKNVETIAQLIEAVKHYLGLNAEYVRLDVTDKLVRLLTHAVLLLSVVLIALAVMLFVSMALVWWLSQHIGFVGAFFAVAGLHVLVFLIIFMLRKPLIERPLVRYLSNLILK